jgi:beta-phosphoglucomutase-like phosphatase (HAD superfamily)
MERDPPGLSPLFDGLFPCDSANGGLPQRGGSSEKYYTAGFAVQHKGLAMSRYRCLILDHDDTVFNSTAIIHYPAYLAMMRTLRPKDTPLSLEGWFAKNFNPGIESYLRSELALTDDEMAEEYRIWRSFSTQTVPSFYPGMIELLLDFKERGGVIAVASHSEKDVIEMNYRVASDARVAPDFVFGWELPGDKRKPSPWPVLETLRAASIEPSQALVVDDLKPGLVMARASGVAIAAAGWGHNVPEIRQYMREQCDAYLSTVEEFRSFVLDGRAP